MAGATPIAIRNTPTAGIQTYRPTAVSARSSHGTVTEGTYETETMLMIPQYKRNAPSNAPPADSTRNGNR